MTLKLLFIGAGNIVNGYARNKSNLYLNHLSVLENSKIEVFVDIFDPSEEALKKVTYPFVKNKYSDISLLLDYITILL